MKSVENIQLYGTLGCHLCEQAEVLLISVINKFPGSFHMIRKDIIDHPDLLEQYGERIPVVVRGINDTELGWPFSSVDLEVFLD